MSNQLPRPFQALHENSALELLLPEVAKLRHIQMTREEKGKQRLPVAATQQEQPEFPSDLLGRR